jgi:hypothetical protein
VLAEGVVANATRGGLMGTQDAATEALLAQARALLTD